MMPMFQRPIEAMAGYWARRRKNNLNPGNPLSVLRQLLERAASTRYGREMGFSKLLQARDLYLAYCENVPTMDYADWVSWLGDTGPNADD